MKRLLSFVFADVTIPHRVMLAAWLTWAVSYWFVGEAVFKGTALLLAIGIIAFAIWESGAE